MQLRNDFRILIINIYFDLLFIFGGIEKYAIILMFMVSHHLLESSSYVIRCPLLSVNSTVCVGTFSVWATNFLHYYHNFFCFSHSFVVRNATMLEQNSTKNVSPSTNETADILKSFHGIQ